MCKEDGCDRPVYCKLRCTKHYHAWLRTDDPEIKPRPRGSLEERFWRYVVKKGEDECWVWIGQKIRGYGRVSKGKRGDSSVGAHRFSWSLHNKQEVPEGMLVMHKCDNPECTNPNHLTIGTAKDNVYDMINKGRKRTVAPIGTENGKALLNEEKVRFIRANHSVSHVKLAKVLGVSPNCIRGVRIGRTWSHIC